MESTLTAEIDAQYRQLREECGLVARPDHGQLDLTGDEAVEYLQGQVTNDVEAIELGDGLYAALLDRKAKVQADLRVLRLPGGELRIDTSAAALPAATKHLQMYKIGRDVTIADRTGERALTSVIGPGAASVTGIEPGPAHRHRFARVGGIECLAVSAPIGELPRLGFSGLGEIPGLDLFCAAEEVERLRETLAAEGAYEVDEQAAEVLRIEAGVPRFGREITPETMPAEAGIVERAISFTKGCYIGQEPVARLHYRGRPNRVLRRLELSAAGAPGEPLWLDDKQVGVLTSAAVSPARGPLGLAILRREAEPGATLRVGDGPNEARVPEARVAETEASQ
ncbi:MAG TPA: folate-binding protein [Solirubrobacterales bacterium]|nr:folate-binding protein [Solirubrobacterales bacterium]